MQASRSAGTHRSMVTVLVDESSRTTLNYFDHIMIIINLRHDQTSAAQV